MAVSPTTCTVPHTCLMDALRCREQACCCSWRAPPVIRFHACLTAHIGMVAVWFLCLPAERVRRGRLILCLAHKHHLTPPGGGRQWRLLTRHRQKPLSDRSHLHWRGRTMARLWRSSARHASTTWPVRLPPFSALPRRCCVGRALRHLLAFLPPSINSPYAGDKPYTL